MVASDYMRTPGWAELIDGSVHGRQVKVWRERLRRITDLLEVAAVRPEFDLIVQGERRISFGEFLGAIEVGARALQERGVERGDHVLLVLYNSPEFLLAQWSAWRLGAIPVLGNRWWSDRELGEAIGLVKPAVTVTDRALDGLGARALTLEEVAGWWAAPAPARAADPGGDENEVAVIVFTAGSTGVPKGVQVSHRNLLHTQQTLHVMRGARPPAPATPADQSVALMTTPLFHNGGLTAGLSALLDGNRMVLPRGRFDAREVLELIERERVTSWNAVPTMYQRVLDHPEFGRFDLSSLKAPSTGGAMVPPRLFEMTPARFPGAAAGMTTGYGMTEASFLTIAPGTLVAQRPGTVGRPIPSVQLGIAWPDENGEGEVIARSAAVMVGYFAADVQPVDEDGWYHTGDLGRIDGEGYLHITGRLKDVVIRGGENIACPHVEYALAEHPDVIEVSVLGIPHADLGEELAAAVFTERDDLEEAELVAFGRERLAGFEVPSRWLILREQLPTLPTGKIDRPTLRARLARPG